MANKFTYKLVVEKMDLGSCLHTALRKACDSNATSLAYNLIHLDDMNHVWLHWLDGLWKEFCKLLEATQEGVCQEELLTCCREASSEPYLEFGSADHNCLRLAFANFDDDDWMGMLAYAFKVMVGTDTG